MHAEPAARQTSSRLSCSDVRLNPNAAESHRELAIVPPLPRSRVQRRGEGFRARVRVDTIDLSLLESLRLVSDMPMICTPTTPHRDRAAALRLFTWRFYWGISEEATALA